MGHVRRVPRLVEHIYLVVQSMARAAARSAARRVSPASLDKSSITCLPTGKHDDANDIDFVIAVLT